MEQAGCSVVGMTAMPEAGLAREAGLAYASCCHVVNYAAGRSETDIHAQIQANVEAGYSVITGVVERFLESL
jgi:purine nucleoside phosphorylase